MLTETRFERPATQGRRARTVHQQIKAVRVTLKSPARPDRTLAEVSVTALPASEPHPPADEDPLDWRLLTNLPVETPEQAIEKLSWSLCRWQISSHFKALKSGCRVEQLPLKTRERLEPALAFCLIIAQPPSLDTMVRMVASLGGFLNRKHDSFPGPKTLWIGL